MKPLNLPIVVSLGVGALALGTLVAALMVRYASHPATVTPLICALFLLLALWLWIGGRAVKRLKAKEKTWVTPMGATRVAILARASGYVTSACSGFLGGVAIVSFTRLWASAMAFAAWSSLAGAVSALLACVVAVVVERWCVDTSGDEDEDRGIRERGASPAR